MDLSEIPHDQWDYSVLQLALLNSSEEEGRADNSIYENEIPEVEQFLSQPLQTVTEDGIKYTIFGGSGNVCTSLAVDRFSGIDSYWNTHSAGYDMIVASERRVSNCLDNGDMYQLEQEQESIMQLTSEYCPEFSDSTALQEFGIPGTASNSALVVANTPWGDPLMEGSFPDDIFRMTTFDPGYSQFVDYPESLNEWLTYFATAGGNSLYIPGLACGQNDIFPWIPPSHECSSDPPLALMDGHYAGEMEPGLSCTKEEEERTRWSRKKKGKHQSGTGEERDCVQRRRKRASQTGEGTKIVQRRGKRSSHSENGEERKIVQRRRKRVVQIVTEEKRESVRRSERVRGAPHRYIDEWCKPKEKGKNNARKAVITASKGSGSGASSSLSGSSTVHQLEDASKTSFMSFFRGQPATSWYAGEHSPVVGLVPVTKSRTLMVWWGPEVSEPGMVENAYVETQKMHKNNHFLAFDD